MRDSHPRRRAAQLNMLLLGLLLPSALLAQVIEDRSPAIKAAYLIQIPRYVFWPKNRANPFKGGTPQLRIIVLGNSPTTRVLETLSRRAGALPYRVVVRRKPSGSALTPEDIAWAHVVYAPSHEDCKLVHAAYPSQPYLLVTDGARGTEAGAAVAFYISENKVRLELAPYQASARGIEFSSKLLRIAGTVRRGPNQAQR